jgi:hypothetical protein
MLHDWIQSLLNTESVTIQLRGIIGIFATPQAGCSQNNPA